MTYKEFIDRAKPEFEKSFKFLEAELAKIRTSRASPALVEDIEVNAFGQKFTIKQLGSISTPSNNQIVIQPWDTSYIEPIEKAMAQSGLGMSCVVDKNLIRLNLPMLTEEYRLSLGKVLNEKAEQAKQVIRRQREDVWNKIQSAEKAKEMSEDDKFRGKDELQKIVDQYQEKMKTLVEKKKQELV
ncbi:MAG: ribosome recycling factor [Candidatus Staskawiczbacteria bacterium]|jgi:ribosome recycling factor